ncbi:MAG: aminotransferase class V-fold PLP-dependent enzyme [Saprospiraceae bacterium]|nr:aminotransferase class V-fold PLP-dependent enzyme [Saprospiraceae bacterium]MCB0624877.1 aminotransferase class V-fold PLP-dependent enzyme [Saprospiraceae bacterium]
MPLTKTSQLEAHFAPFRQNIVGIDATFRSPYGEMPVIYADWIASGRLYRPIEEAIANVFGPMVGNTHSESSETGRCMTHAYHLAHKIIKQHVNARDTDVLITCGSGMTGAVAKFQRILGLRIPEKLEKYLDIPREERPVVFITHMEHHSNQTTWLESIAEVVVLPPDDKLFVDPKLLDEILPRYADRKMKIGSFSACSNVTGIMPPYHELAAIMHKHGGYCFVDFAASAPYVDIDMHPADPAQKLDAIFFSPHKFLGGPGSSGVLVFCKSLYHNRIPDHPGGGTVTWTNPWGEHSYFDDIEIREDGGTPGFLQAIRTALAIRLKEQMGTGQIHRREKELIGLAFEALREVPGLRILGDGGDERLGVFSFYIEGMHHNLVVRLLNDRYGIQVRGGCSCAGTYGHFLLNVDREFSKNITDRIDQGDLSLKPGWVRLSLHPTMTNDELALICQAIREVAENGREWEQDYEYSCQTNEYYHRSNELQEEDLQAWFELG